MLEEHKRLVQYVKKNWHQPKSLLNPIDSYKRLSQNVFGAKQILQETLTKLTKFKLEKFNSTSKDYQGALNGLLLLQGV